MTVQKTEAVDRAGLHHLVDAIPTESLEAARDGLKPFIDPVLFAFLTAPVDDDELVTDEDRSDLQAARDEYRRGETLSNEDVRRAMGW